MKDNDNAATVLTLVVLGLDGAIQPIEIFKLFVKMNMLVSPYNVR